MAALRQGDAMYEFRSGGGGVLALDANFSDVTYANISFFDAALAEIVLHISLRADEGVAVFNRRIGGVWGKERTARLPGRGRLSRGGLRL